MNKAKIGVLLISLLTLGSCQKEEPANTQQSNQTQTTEEAPNLIGDATLAMPELEDETTEARVMLSVDDVTSKVKFRYDDRSDREIFLLFTRSNDGQSAVAKGRVVFKNPTPKRGETDQEAAARHYQCQVLATIPAGFDPKRGVDVTVSGIFGGGLTGNPLNKNGVVNLSSPRKLYFASKATREYDLPYYFTDRKLSYNSQLGKYTFDAKFTMYGSLLAVEMRNKLIEPFRPTWLKVETDVMSFEGSLSLKNIKDGIPQWTPSSDAGATTTESHTRASKRVKGRLFTLEHLELPAATPEGRRGYNAEADRRRTTTHVFIWGVGSNKTGKITATSAENPYLPDADQEVQARFKKEKTSKKPLEHARAYALSIRPSDPALSFDGDLIITEYYHSGVADGLRNVVELYNPTSKRIDLAQYYLVKTNYTGSNTYNHQLTLRLDGSELLQPEADTGTHLHQLRQNGSTRYLEPGAFMILNSYNVILNNADYNSAQIILHVGDKSIVKNDAEYNKPLSGGTRGALMLFKGKPDLNKLSNLVDNLGVVSDGPITMDDVRNDKNTMYFGDGFVRRRPDRNLPNRTLLKQWYWPPKVKTPNLDGATFPRIKLPSSKYTMEEHINHWDSDRPLVDWLFTGSGDWGLTGKRSMGLRFGTDII